MGVERRLRHLLPGEAQTDEQRPPAPVQGRQRPVVIASALPQPPSPPVEGEQRDKD